jgi:hypothetical protein
VLLFQSCGKGSKTQTVELKGLTFNYEGPLIEGANTGQYSWKIDLKELLGDQYKEGMKIKGATLLKAEISADPCEDCVGFDAIKSLVLSFASNNKKVPMQEVAFLNPINSKKEVQHLGISSELDLKKFLNEKEIYLILDADLKQDWDDDFTLNAHLTLDLSFD